MKHIHRLTNVTAKLVYLVVFLLAGGISIPVAAQVHQKMSIPEAARAINHTLMENLRKVFMIGREVGNAETLQAILLQESGGRKLEPVGNKSSPVGKRSYGLMQVQLQSARSILERHPELVAEYFPDRTYRSLADEEVIALLLTNDEANIRIAAYHFKLYMSLSGGDWNRAVAAYNVGIGGVTKIPDPSTYDYVVRVKAKLQTIKPVNKLLGLES